MSEAKRAVISGASRGIGRGIALRLAQAGYDIAFSYASGPDKGSGHADATARTIREQHGRDCHIFDVSLEEDGASGRFVHDAVDALGGLELLVSNAGTTIYGNILTMSEDDMDFLYRLDFKNYIMLMRAAAEYFVQHRIAGSIVAVSSTRAERSYREGFMYGALKSGLNRAVECIALDLAPYGVRVNAVMPGATRIRPPGAEQQELTGDPTIDYDIFDVVGQSVPLGRVGEPQDIGDAVVYLASEQASYITGTALRIDGGLVLPGSPEPGMPEHVDLAGTDLGWS